MVRYRDATTSSSAIKVQGEVTAHFNAVAIKPLTSKRNWLFGLPERILCEQPPWCQRKWQACSSLCSSPVSPFPVSMSLDFPCTAHASFPERLSNHRQGLRRTFSEIFTNSDAVPFWGSSRNRIRPDTRLQIKGRKKSARPTSCVKFCTPTPKIRHDYHLPLQHANTTAAQMAAPVPEIMDIPS
jgi:hypothetical protein